MLEKYSKPPSARNGYRNNENRNPPPKKNAGEAPELTNFYSVQRHQVQHKTKKLIKDHSSCLTLFFTPTIYTDNNIILLQSV